MRMGAVLVPFSPERSDGSLADRARRYAEAGFTSLWAASSMGRGVFMVDPFVALTVAASVTQDVELGTGIIQVPLHHPVELAHRILSLVEVCGGRLILGVGAGSSEADFAALQRDYSGRLDALHRDLAPLRSLLRTGQWGDVSLNPIPGPAPPIFYGTWGGGIERAAREFDGWIASARFAQAQRLEAQLKRYRAAGGRRAIVTTIIVNRDTDLGKLRARLQQYADYGFDDAVIMFMPGAPDPERVRALA